jgi:ATP-dependent DNA helicase DinG
MLSQDIKQLISNAYSTFLKSKELGPRHGQRVMIAEIAKTLGSIDLDDDGVRLNESHICIVEAGTGTGKTISYLLPSLILAKEMDKTLVISTATVALQEQIVNKDLPDLLKHSGLSFTFALAKGRARYVCNKKLNDVVENRKSEVSALIGLYEDELPELTADGLKPYKAMQKSLRNGEWTGERDTWKKTLQDKDWRIITSDHHECTGKKCPNYHECGFYKAREKMYVSDCIVANHDLVMADLSLGGGAVLQDPAQSIYVFDEGHHLPQKALGHFAQQARLQTTQKWLNQCLEQVDLILASFDGNDTLFSYVEKLPGHIKTCKEHLEYAYSVLGLLVETIDTSKRESNYRFKNGEIPSDISIVAKNLNIAFSQLTELLFKIEASISIAMDDPDCGIPREELEIIHPIIGGWIGRSEANLELWKTYSYPDTKKAAPNARWLNPVFSQGVVTDIDVCSSPILADEVLKRNLWDRACGVILTSATMTSLGNFESFRMRSGVPADANYHIVQSPFDFSRATFSVPKNAVDASIGDAHTQSIINGMPTHVVVGEGTLVLFSSRKQMLEVHKGLSMKLQDIIFLQGDYSKQEIIDRHKTRIDDGKESIIFGLASFSEGVDLPGKYCSHVVIAKIPFSVPDDPIEAALSEWVEHNGGNSFMEISVPDASFKLIQASGRLMRSESDSGTISVYDKRLLTKRYGKQLIDALPPFSRKLG